MKQLKWILIFFATVTISAKDIQVIELMDFRRDDLEEQGFVLKKAMDIKIEAYGMSDRYEDEMLATGWILDKETRQVVWKMTPDNSKASRKRYLRKTEDSIKLSAGEYELYYAVSPRGTLNGGYHDLGDFLDDLFGGFRSNKYRREADDWGIILSIDEGNQNNFELSSISDRHDAIVKIAPAGDDEYEKRGFSLSKRTKVRIYAIGEGDDDDEMYDYGWIIDASTGERVWEMKYRRARWAGGAEKNLVVDTNITLDKGDYIVHFVSDGSHSYDDWNRMAPHDPHYWGITLWGAEKGFKKDIVVKAFKPEENKKIIVDLIRIGNNRYEEEGFTLKKESKIRVRCLGEYSSGEFADYGWIVDAKTKDIVWEMTRRNTRHAGGGRKNKIFDGIITLDPGNYQVFYVSDGSHSFRRWNTGPPFDPEAWGITLFGVGEDFDPKSVTSFREADDPDILVQLTRAGDHERLRRSFRLKETTEVRVYAIGEGEDDEMYDYGWIENERGRKVWRMEYWDTRHAGGGRKNRVVNDIIELEPGEYTVFYRSDGTHSYEDWNVDRPRDFINWGITVQKEK